MKKIVKTPEQWQAQLDSEQYRVTRQAGTEAPFSGLYCDHNDSGVYHCVCCSVLTANFILAVAGPVFTANLIVQKSSSVRIRAMA